MNKLISASTTQGMSLGYGCYLCRLKIPTAPLQFSLAVSISECPVVVRKVTEPQQGNWVISGVLACWRYQRLPLLFVVDPAETESPETVLVMVDPWCFDAQPLVSTTQRPVEHSQMGSRWARSLWNWSDFPVVMFGHICALIWLLLETWLYGLLTFITRFHHQPSEMTWNEHPNLKSMRSS